MADTRIRLLPFINQKFSIITIDHIAVIRKKQEEIVLIKNINHNNCGD